MPTGQYYPRFIRPRLLEALQDTPVVLIHGPRQCGKTTLARQLGDQAGYTYVSFDDDVQKAAAQADPIGFITGLPEKVILDEVQRVPELFTSIKAEIDRDRTPGRFILTGSANVLMLPKLADSLAGRMEILRLYPLAHPELAGTDPGFLEHLFNNDFKRRKSERLGRELAERVSRGGYPVALARASAKRRAAWYRDYIETLIVKDVRDYGHIRSLEALPRLMQLASSQSARLLNVANLASPFELSRPTIKEYMTLLNSLFLLDTIPAWHINRLKRLVKSPKLHVGDTGIACALLGIDAAALWNDRIFLGQLLETFVYQELRKMASWLDDPIRFSHFRNKDGVEVALVLESGRKITGIEVKASATVTDADFKGLRKLKAAIGKQFVAGIVLYDGDTVLGFGSELHAVPISSLWD